MALNSIAAAHEAVQVARLLEESRRTLRLVRSAIEVRLAIADEEFDHYDEMTMDVSAEMRQVMVAKCEAEIARYTSHLLELGYEPPDEQFPGYNDETGDLEEAA